MKQFQNLLAFTSAQNPSKGLKIILWFTIFEKKVLEGWCWTTISCHITICYQMSPKVWINVKKWKNPSPRVWLSSSIAPRVFPFPPHDVISGRNSRKMILIFIEYPTNLTALFSSTRQIKLLRNFSLKLYWGEMPSYSAKKSQL